MQEMFEIVEFVLNNQVGIIILRMISRLTTFLATSIPKRYINMSVGDSDKLLQ